MIKYQNIVFDMGHVLINYDADWSINRFTENEAVKKEVRDVVFRSGEWILLDAGLITEEEALEGIRAHCSSDEVREVAEKSFAVWDQYNMVPVPGTAEVLYELKRAGKNLYVLSNASLRLEKVYQKYIPAAEILDGVFFSASWKCLKPQEEMYRKFLQHFSLRAEDCFFLDDLQRNIDGAAACGIDGCVYREQDPQVLRRILGMTEK